MTELESNKNAQTDLELDDLLISNNDEEIKSDGGKKILLLGAIAVLLLAIVVLVVYLLQGDSKEQEVESFDATQKPLERVDVQTPTPQETTDYGQEPIAENSDDQFQRIIDQIKSQQQGGNQNLPSAPQAQTSQPTQPVQPAQPAQPEVKSPSLPPQAKPQAKPQKPSAVETFKDVQTSDPSIQGGVATKGFYLQVGSFSKFAPNKQLLGLIENEKLSYRMQKSGDNNRLLIGPYATKQEAQSHLSEIRSKINKDAFIKEIR